MTYDPDIFNSNYSKTFDSMIDLVFLLDIIINFRTSFIHQINGEEITDPYAIAESYFRSGRLLIDVLSTVPFADFFNGGIILRLFGILKIARVSRIGHVILNLNSDKENKASWKIAYLIFQYFMYIHILGCLWYFVVREDERQ